MNQSQKWGRSRYVAFLVVCLLHVALLIALFLLPKTRFLTNSSTPPIELLILPPQNNQKPPPPSQAASSRDKKLEFPTPTPPSPTAITVAPQADVNMAGSAVDWEQEAHNVAAAIAKAGSPQKGRPTETVSPFAPPPAHHAGDQFQTGDGWILYVSDYCYQISSAIPTVSNASHNGMGLQTYCTGRSSAPRGDLFKQLPAYRILHPDN
jgi:hypothetical protein